MKCNWSVVVPMQHRDSPVAILFPLVSYATLFALVSAVIAAFAVRRKRASKDTVSNEADENGT